MQQLSKQKARELYNGLESQDIFLLKGERETALGYQLFIRLFKL